MALVVEDGTCIAGANALVSRADFLAFAADYYPGQTFTDDATTDAAILRTSAWLSSFPEWKGKAKCGRGLQGTAFPRTGMTDCAGEPIPDDAVPVEVQHATFMGTIAEYAVPGVLTPTITPGERRKRVKVDVIEVEYADTDGDPTTALRPVLTTVTDLLRCLATFPGGKAVPWPWVA